MERTYIKDLKTKIGGSAKICGFAQTIRNQGGIKFLHIRDVTGVIQVVILKSEKEAFDLVGTLSTESVLEIEGKVKEEMQAPGGFEMQALSIKVLSVAGELPIPVIADKGAEAVDTTKRLDYRWLDLRLPERQKIFKVWTELEAGFRECYAANNFLQVYTPAFLMSASETGADVFEVKYFDRKAYLAQSPQFHKQMAMAAGMERVFVMGPVFRAEPSFTTRHMTEFTGWDFEMSYVESHHDVMAFEEKLIEAGFARVKEKFPEVNIEVPVVPFPKVTMKEAKEKLKKAGVKSEKIGDLSPEEERELCKMIKEETGHDFVWVTDYPIEVRPFYHMRHADNPKLTKSFDLMYRGVEVTTGAQREHRPEVLEKQALEKGMDLNVIKDYLNFFKYGCPPHGGVGIGPGRLIMCMLELPSVKEATFLPRDVKRLNP